MPLFGNDAVSSASDVDAITKARIKNLVGDTDEELKWHRLTLFAFVVQASPHLASPSELTQARQIAAKVRDLHAKINGFVEEGRRFKRENGYT